MPAKSGGLRGDSKERSMEVCGQLVVVAGEFVGNRGGFEVRVPGQPFLGEPSKGCALLADGSPLVGKHGFGAGQSPVEFANVTAFAENAVSLEDLGLAPCPFAFKGGFHAVEHALGNRAQGVDLLAGGEVERRVDSCEGNRCVPVASDGLVQAVGVCGCRIGGKITLGLVGDQVQPGGVPVPRWTVERDQVEDFVDLADRRVEGLAVATRNLLAANE